MRTGDGQAEREDRSSVSKWLPFAAAFLFMLAVAVFLCIFPKGSSLDGSAGLSDDDVPDGVVGGATGDVADGTPSEGSTPQADAGEGSAEMDRVFSRVPPITLPSSLRPQGYEQGQYIETWRAVSDEPCSSVARELLLEFRDSGMSLVKADYLDLFGEAWGCTLEDGGEASVTVTLIPERPFSQRGESNLLQLTLIRIGVPTQESWAGSTRGEEQ
jgi:hypothetical protein